MAIDGSCTYLPSRSLEYKVVVNVSPPPIPATEWVGAHVGHTVGKYAESLLTPDWAAEVAAVPIAVNPVWPSITLASTGMMGAMGEDTVKARARGPRIMADVEHAVVTRPAADCSGNRYTDEVLREEGVSDFALCRLAVRDEDLSPSFYPPSVPLAAIGAPQ